MDASGDNQTAATARDEAGNNHGSKPMESNATPGQPMSQSKSAAGSAYAGSAAVPPIDPQTANLQLQSMEAYLNYLSSVGSSSNVNMDSGNNTAPSCSSVGSVTNNEASGKPQKKHVCPVCRMDFSDWKDWRGHVRSHTDFRPHHCSMCEKAFCDLYKLRRHEQTHTGVKPYQCHICDTRVSRQEHLRRHLLTHMSDKPYRCSACSMTARRPDIIRSHIRSKHLPAQEIAAVVPVFSIADVEKHLNVSAIVPEQKKKKKKKSKRSTSTNGQDQAAEQPLSHESGSVMGAALSSPSTSCKNETSASQSCAMPQVSPPLNMSAQGSNEQGSPLQLSPVQAKDPIILDSARKSMINSMAHKLGRNTNKGRQPSPPTSQDCQSGGNFLHGVTTSNPTGGTASINNAASCAYPVLITPAVSGPGVNHVNMAGVPNQPGMMAAHGYFNQNWLGSNIFPGPGLIPGQAAGIQLPVTVAGVHVNVPQFVQGTLGIGLKSEGR